ncbi:hypothetical protein [Gorillibacterium sp. sgz5001074]|uniref:hypothetical protein n=1 Tax=Gorillibacterium sp. sgz5001074 TaxID=3446695 RepID=UPI003F66494F
MTIIVGKFPINDGSVVYGPGSVISNLDSSEEHRLVADGYATFPVDVEEMQEGIGLSEMENVQTLPLLSLEEFEKLKKSDQQKEYLSELGLEPAMNEPSRVKQYAEYLDTIDTEDGPNTGLPE